MSDAPTSSVTFEAETSIPTRHGVLRFRAYTDDADGQLHLAIISGEPENGAIVRVHSECLTGEAFGSLKCECGPQLDASLEAIGRDGGIVLYLRGHEGRGIGRLLMAEVESIAREGGARRLVLQTGDRQPDAVALYEKIGFTRIPTYEPYVTTIPQSICFEKPIA